MTITQVVNQRNYGFYINGHHESPKGDTFDRFNPGNGELVATFARADIDTTERAISVAREAFDDGDWPLSSGQYRARILNRLAALMTRDKEKLSRIEADETGKPITQARQDVEGSIGLAEFAAAMALTMHGDTHTNLGNGFTGLITREPCGVVAMVTPWNFPLLQLMQKLPFALAAGCTAVCKPAEVTAGTTLEIAFLLEEAGLPAGVLNVVTGSGSKVGDYMSKSEKVDLLSFTGSTAVGQSIIQASAGSLKRLSMELGGKAASIVFPDADMDKAVEGVLRGVTFNSGECCVSGARLLVHEDIATDFVEALRKAMEKMKVGLSSEEDAEIGAMIHESHLEQVLSFISQARSQGGKVITGGQRLTGEKYDRGFFVSPTIVDEVAEDSSLFRDEVFGPVLSVTRFSTADEAIRLANNVDYGLANTVWSTSLDTSMYVSRRLQSGTVWINTTIDGAPQLPGGGVKKSGYGREMGHAGFEEFTEVKTIQMRTATSL